jgi:hypothetical protein
MDGGNTILGKPMVLAFFLRFISFLVGTEGGLGMLFLWEIELGFLKTRGLVSVEYSKEKGWRV